MTMDRVAELEKALDQAIKGMEELTKDPDMPVALTAWLTQYHIEPLRNVLQKSRP
jgi:hypothetical protein